MSVVALGYYGMRNFGDDIFRHVIDRNHADIWPGESVRFVAPKPNDSSITGRLYGGANFIGAGVRSIATLRSVRFETKAYCGGSLFQDVAGTRLLHMRLAGLNVGSYEALGVSLGPFPHPAARAKVETFLKNFQRIIVRDRASVSVASDMALPVTFGGDLAGLLPAPDKSVTSGEQARPIVVCHVGGTPDLGENFPAGVATLLREMPAAPVVVLSLNSHPLHGDDLVSSFLVDRLTRCGVEAHMVRYKDIGLVRSIELLQSAQLCISTRLHGGIVAYLGNVPVVLMAYHSKVSDFADDVGLPKGSVLPLDAPRSDWARAGACAMELARFSPESYRARAIDAYFRGDMT